MKKPASQALCCLCLVLLLPVTATERWCKHSDNFKWMTQLLQDGINELNDNLLPNMVKYDVFTGINAAELTDHCFIIVTAQQLNSTLLRLMSNFGTNTTNHKQTEEALNNLTNIYTSCSDENSHRCLKPDTKVVTAYRSDLFAYFQAVLNHYKYIFGQCKPEDRTTKPSEGYLNFLKASAVSISSNCHLVDLRSESQSKESHENTSSRPSYNASAPQPSSTLVPPVHVQTVMGDELRSSTGVTSTVASVVTEDNSGSTATNQSALFGGISTDDPRHSDGNLTQKEFSARGTAPGSPPTSSSAALNSQTVCAPIEAAGTASPHEDKQHIYSQKYLYLFMGTLLILFLVLCANLYCYSKTRRMTRWNWRESLHANYEADVRGVMVSREILLL